MPKGISRLAPITNRREKWRTVAVRSAVWADHEAGRVAQEQHRQAEGVAQLQEARGLVGAVGVDRTAQVGGVVGNDAEWLAVDPRQRGDDARAEAIAQLQDRALVAQRRDHASHLVRALALLGDQVAQEPLIWARRTARIGPWK